jgi:polyvinyl alcohol dehydrogenase (cytochrome)
VVNGVVYIGADTGVFYALDEATGAVLWQQFLGFVPAKTCGARGIASTATLALDPVSGALTVYVAGGDGYLYALSAATGAITWKSVIALPSPTTSDYYDWSSPTVVNSRIYVGVASQCDNPLVMGGLKEYDQATGNLLATYLTNPGGTNGASIWSSAAAPASGKYVFVSTGNAKHGDSTSIVRLNGATLARQGHWKVSATQQTHDSDFGSSPTLFTATLSGKPTQMVGACNKNGIYYALRRNSLHAGPVWQFQVGAPYTPPGVAQCDAAAVWDGSHLFIAGNATTIGGVSYRGSVRMVDPATGNVIWAQGLPGPVIGTPALDGAGVLSVPLYGKGGTYLLDAATGAILRNIPGGIEFGQAVFADNMLLVPTQDNGLWGYR